MEFIKTKIEGLVVIEPKVFEDNRGCFFESYNKEEFKQFGIDLNLVQDNVSVSAKGVVRGLHYQLQPFAQAKLVSVARGAVFDVTLDLRKDSATFGQWYGIELSAENKKSLFIPTGFAHGFCALTDDARLTYKQSNFYKPEFERAIVWNDAQLAIAWPAIANPELVSDKDKIATPFKEAELDS